MNLLTSAIAKIASIYPSKHIQINNYYCELINGVDFKYEFSSNAIANVQTIEGSKLRAYATYIDSYDYKRFYIVGTNLKIISSILEKNFTNAIINLDNIYYNIYYREDWSLNGWIIADGVASGKT